LSFFVSVSSTAAIHGFSAPYSSCVSRGLALKAMPRTPNSAACFAAANVPECHIAVPRFKPWLMPLSTTSTWLQWWIPSAMQSAGVPFTRQPSKRPMRVGR